MKPTEFDLGLPDDVFWTDLLEKGEEALDELGLGTDHIIGIGAPKVIDIERRRSFPLLICQNGSPKDHYHYDLESSGLIVAIDAERNELYRDIAVETEENEAPKEETRDQSYTITTNYAANLKSRLGMDLRPGKYLTVILNREYVSNRVVTIVKASDSFYKDKEVIEEQRKETSVPDIWPPLKEKMRKTSLRPLSLPVYAKYEDSPELPEENGISIEVPRVQFARKDSVCLVRGSFRLLSAYGIFVPPAQRTKSDIRPAEYVRMPIHLVVTGEKSSNPFTGRIMVPVYDELKDPDESKPVTGYFAFDLLKHVNLTEAPQTYFLYLFSGEVMVGPVPFAFVDPKEIDP